MINRDQLRELTNRVLNQIDLYSPDASNLLMGTFAQESSLGYYLKQLGSGAGLGIGQMERKTFDDLLNRGFVQRPALMTRIALVTGVDYIKFSYLEWNIALSIAMTRLKYLSIPKPLPNSITGYANYWKKYYNTYKGSGTVEQFIKNYHKYILS